MKKTLIASAASLALAAMPVVGALAVDNLTITDNFEITIDKTCTISAVRADGTGVGAGTWDTDTKDTIESTLSGTIANATTVTNFGSTTMTVVCNNEDGWEVTAETTDLESADGDATIAWNADFDGNTTSGVSWTVSQAEENGLTIADGAQGEADDESVAKLEATTTTAGKSFTVTYGVGISEDQAAGTYTGSIVYTLAEL